MNVWSRFAGGAIEPTVFVPEDRCLAFVILTSSAPGAVLVKGTVAMLPPMVEARAWSAQAVSTHLTGTEGLLSP